MEFLSASSSCPLVGIFFFFFLPLSCYFLLLLIVVDLHSSCKEIWVYPCTLMDTNALSFWCYQESSADNSMLFRKWRTQYSHVQRGAACLCLYNTEHALVLTLFDTFGISLVSMTSGQTRRGDCPTGKSWKAASRKTFLFVNLPQAGLIKYHYALKDHWALGA